MTTGLEVYVLRANFIVVYITLFSCIVMQCQHDIRGAPSQY